MTTYADATRILSELIDSPRTDAGQDRLLEEAHQLVLEAQEAALHTPPHRPPPDEDDDEEPPRELPPRVVIPKDTWGDGRQVNWDGKTPKFTLHDAVMLGGYRSCLIGLMGTVHRTEMDIRNVAFRSTEPNGPPSWSGTGALWAERSYGIVGGVTQDVEVVDFFGKGMSRDLTAEGHGFYRTLSPVKGSVLLYKRCMFRNIGGHAIYHTSSAQPGREGNAPKPEDGGLVRIEDVMIEDSDISVKRGAYAISLTDAYARHELRGVTVHHDGSYARQNTHEPDYYRSRGLLLAEGLMPGGLLVEDSHFHGAQPADRSAQVFIEGPETVVLKGSNFDCNQVSVNDPWGDKPGTLKTKKLVLSECVGTAVLRWNGKELGRVSDVRSGEWTL